MIQVITRTGTHIRDVVPTQIRREAYVESRRDRWKQPYILQAKLATGKTSTPSLP